MGRALTEMVQLICGDMWSVTPYSRCDYRCTYCITRVQGASEPMHPRDEAVAELRAWLADQGDTDPLCILGGLADAYPSVEADQRVTRAILEVLVDHGARITIVTKGDTVLRDLDLLTAAGDRCMVHVSVCSTNADALRRIDGSSPPPSVRLDVLRQLHAAGVPVELNALPWIPGVSDIGALLACVPEDVRVTVAPLSFGPDRDRLRLLDTTFVREEVWEAYRDEYARFGHVPNTSWVKPSMPPNENQPLYRLPTLGTCTA